MATPAEYAAAEAAVQKHANVMIAQLGGFEQNMVRQHLSSDLLNGFAKVAVDALDAFRATEPKA